MGHIGLTPQSVNQLGGFRVQGREEKGAELLLSQAHRLEDAGCFSIVLECIPASVAAKITQEISIPLIGIGAGPGTDGQILVLQDMLGTNKDFNAKFVRRFMKGHELISEALSDYHNAVLTGDFPAPQESYE